MTTAKQSLEQKKDRPHLRRERWLLALVLFAAVVIAYFPALRGGFLWDDDAHISANRTLLSWEGLQAIWLTPGATCQYYPLSFTVWWVCWHLWGLAPVGYHIVTLMMHLCAALLLWQVLERLEVRGAWLAGAIFALHPVNVMSVAWMTELKNTLSTSLALCAVWGYLRFAGLGAYAGAADKSGRGAGSVWRWYGVSLGLFILAMLAKTAVSFVPVSLLLITWWKRGRLGWRDVWPVLPMVGLVKLFGAATFRVERMIGAVGGQFHLSILERVLVSGRSFWFYLGKLLFPYPLTFIYERWKVDAHAGWQYLFPLATVGLFAALWWWRERIGRGAFAAFLHFYICTSMLILGEVLFFTQYSFVSDHWQYFGCMSLFALAAAGLTTGLDALGDTHPSIKPVFCSLLLLTLATLTWRQCAIYRDTETLWNATIANNSSCWMAYNNLGLVSDGKGEADNAITDFQKALEVKPDYAEAENNLGTALQQEGRSEEAIDHFQNATELKPDYAEAYNNLALAYRQQGRFDEAVANFQKAIAINPRNVEAEYNYAIALQQRGRLEEAAEHFQKVIEIKPDDSLAHYNLAIVLRERGRMTDAIGEYQKALAIKPDYAEAENDLGNAFAQEGQPEEAIAHFRKAVAINPSYAAAHDDLAIILSQEGRLEEAIEHFQKAIEIKPGDSLAEYNLAIALQRTNRFDEAITHYQKAIEINPNFADAHCSLATVFQQTGRLDEAIAQYEKAIEIKPDYAEAEDNLGNALQQAGRSDEAAAHFQKAFEIKPGIADTHYNLAVSLRQSGHLDQAISEYEETIDGNPDFLKAYTDLAYLLATCPDPNLRDGVKAEEIAQHAVQLTGGKDPNVLGILAAAYAAEGGFSDAKQTVQRALDIAQTQNDPALITLLQQDKKLYEAGEALRDGR